jgi:hypothetical protein
MEQNMYDQQEARLAAVMGQHFAMRVFLVDPTLIKDLMDFYSWASGWLLHLLGPDEEAGDPLLCLIPEHYMEDLVETFVHISRYLPGELTTCNPQVLEQIVRLLISLCAGPKRIKNPHLRGQFSEIFKALCPDSENSTTLDPSHLFMTSPFIKARLLPALVDLYAGAEFQSSQTRHAARAQINELLALLWGVRSSL